MSTDQAAVRLWDAASNRKTCAPVRDLIGEGDIASAYGVQDLSICKRIDAGARRVGRKIGMTSAAVQKQLGYYEPNYGTLFADCEASSGEQTSKTDCCSPELKPRLLLCSDTTSMGKT